MQSFFTSASLHRAQDKKQGLLTKLCTLMAIAAVLLLMSAMVAAQVTSGTIFGTVEDATGAVIPGATVVASSPQMGVSRTVTAGETGNFVFPNLPPGTYTITVEFKGFKKLVKDGVILSAADRLNSGEFKLEAGASDTSVTVTADAGELQLQSNSGERSDLVTGKQINDLALNGRNVLDYMKVIPGVSGLVDGSSSGTGGLDSFNINGTRANEHEFTIDGASNVDTGNNGGTHVTLNTDAIAEVKVLTSNYQAEYGKAAGGQIAVTTKSGTNQFHGNARFFHRNEGMNANNWFNDQNGTPIAKYRYNSEGYQVGGPVIIPGTGLNKSKDKLYFFWSQEFYQQLVPGSVTQFRTPTALERNGDFSQSFDGDGNPLTIYDPATGQPLPGNKINFASLSPEQQQVFTSIQKVMNLYPLPNVSGNNQYNFSQQLSYDNPRREDILRIDYQLNSKNRIYGRWVHNGQSITSPMQDWNLSCMGTLQFAGGCSNTTPGWNLSFNVVSTIRPNLLNEFSVGPSVNRSTWTGLATSVGQNDINLPLLYAVTPDTSVPDISFNGNGGNSGVNYPWSYLGANPWFQANTTININDNLTWVKNNHTFKFGLFYQRSRKDQIAWGNSNGQFSFNNCATGDATCDNNTGSPYASALLGYFDGGPGFQQSSARPTGYFRYNQLEFYLQDTWKATSRLTLDYGMRFAWIPPQFDAKNQIALFDPTKYDPSKAVQIDPNDGSVIVGSGDSLNGIAYTANGTLPQGGWDSRGVMPEPRLGFAYDLFDNHKTVLRGGFGMTHDRTQGNLVFNTVFGNPAMVVTPGVSSGNIADLPSMAQQAQAGMNQPLSGIYGAAPNGKVPTVYSYSLGVQHELGWGTTMDVAYVGTLSRHLVTARDINAIPYGTTFTAAAQNPAAYTDYCANPAANNPCTNGVPAVEPNLPPEYAAAGLNFSGINAYNTNYLVPYKGYGNIEYYEFNGTANYNALQVSVQRRFTRGLTFGAAYTWSKTLTTANSDEDWQDPFNPSGLDYRAASWDRTHVLAINYVYDIPSLTKHFGGPKWLGLFTDNYQFSGITNFMTGAPSADYPTNGSMALWVPANQLSGSNQWGKLPPAWIGVDRSGNLILPTLGQPYAGTRDLLRGGGMQNWDMSLFKNFPIGSSERTSIQLRLEAFNVFNHPNFQDRAYGANLTLPSYDSGSGTFVPYSITKASNWGQPTSQYTGVGGPRVIQLGAKLYF
ncbi:MAG TPA: carboxypeptidase regulatory-like domain-containing protein [Terriglobales bacterium]|nr:carboxypeptidase regulatory-like domain-containing protein [Terriglobales bacterium]